jgi:hypothetical protein
VADKGKGDRGKADRGNAGRGKAAAKGTDDGARRRDDSEQRGFRARLTRRMMKIPFLRRMYAKRVLRYLDKSRQRGRPIPDEMAQLDDYLSRLPEQERAAVLEATLSGELESGASRAMRRAAGRQGRQSGRGGGRQRPGAPPTIGPRPRPR